VKKSKGSAELSHPKEGWVQETVHYVQFKAVLPRPSGMGTSLQTVYAKLFAVEILADGERVNAEFPQDVPRVMYVGYETSRAGSPLQPLAAVTEIENAPGYNQDNQPVTESDFAKKIVFQEHKYLVLLKKRPLREAP
jgi:hypothetical protein